MLFLSWLLFNEQSLALYATLHLLMLFDASWSCLKKPKNPPENCFLELPLQVLNFVPVTKLKQKIFFLLFSLKLLEVIFLLYDLDASYKKYLHVKNLNYTQLKANKCKMYVIVLVLHKWSALKCRFFPVFFLKHTISLNDIDEIY